MQLLDCFSLPTVLVLSWLLVKARYRLTHIGGMALALMSVVAIVWIDVDDGKGGVGEGGQSANGRSWSIMIGHRNVLHFRV